MFGYKTCKYIYLFKIFVNLTPPPRKKKRTQGRCKYNIAKNKLFENQKLMPLKNFQTCFFLAAYSISLDSLVLTTLKDALLLKNKQRDFLKARST